MEYGLIGEKLSHSYSKEIHESLGRYQYELKEIEKDRISDFLTNKDFKGINVTIPYKETVIPFLDVIDDKAKEIGAVNTIVNRDGLLYGYNTDFYGMLSLIRKSGFDLSESRVLILGTGGTSKTAMAVCNFLKAKEIVRVSRHEGGDAITYEKALSDYTSVDFIINTTPAGMYPKIDACAISLKSFKNLKAVYDVIYNPCRTRFMLEAESMHINAFGGLKMLVGQAFKAAELFLSENVDESLEESVFKKIRAKHENIVLIGMPGAGKSTIGRILSDKLKYELIDTDKLIVEREECEISDIFSEKGEGYFRDLESDVIKEVSLKKNVIISTGGGAILRDENVNALKAYGRLYFLNRDLSALKPTSDRPLADDFIKIKKLYDVRLPIYKKAADETIDGDKGIDFEISEILRLQDEY